MAGEEAVQAYGGKGRDEIRELWEWAGITANEEARKHEWGGDYTLAEMEAGIENVVTGLKDEGGEDEEREEEDMGGVSGAAGVNGSENEKGEERGGKLLAMDDILRFLVRGEEPKK